MNSPRHAAAHSAASPLLTGLRAAIALLTGALAAVLAVWGFFSVRIARHVVTPACRVPDTHIVDLDTAAQTITLARTPDTVLPGRYGLITSGTESYLKLGSVLAADDRTVKRKLLTHIGGDARLSSAAGFSGWYYDSPEQLHVPFSSELIGSALGPCPAWLFPAGDGDVWVIQIHGRGTNRTECLRAVPVFRDLGITSLLVSYRNDGVGPRSRTGTYALGATEWRDVDSAIGFARRRGAKRVALMGWSMGGAIALQTALNSAHRVVVAGIVLESPVIDWRAVLEFQIGAAGVPRPVTQLAMRALRARWASGLTGTEAGIPLDRLDILARAAELRHPILILHSDDDGFVPSDASHDLVVARPDLVSMRVFDTARHTKLWNYDQDRWTRAISSWLAERGLTAASAAPDA
ncbi:MAG: alpha/beta fold hydrolase [Microbacterium sp.]